MLLLRLRRSVVGIAERVVEVVMKAPGGFGIGWRAGLLLASVVALVGSIPAIAGAERLLGMAQLAGAQGCIAQPDESSEAYRGCGRGRGLIDPNDVSVAGDGRNLYVAASGAGAVASFERESGSGRIAEVNCVSANGTSGVDGTEHACADGDALAQAAAVTVSHDGMFVYASSYASSGIAIFARSEATGALKQVGCVRAVRTCVSARALGGASAVAISPDGLNAYLAASEADAVSQFKRDPSNGLLSPLGCISDDGTDRLCVNGNALRGADAVAISPDGKERLHRGRDQQCGVELRPRREERRVEANRLHHGHGSETRVLRAGPCDERHRVADDKRGRTNPVRRRLRQRRARRLRPQPGERLDQRGRLRQPTTRGRRLERRMRPRVADDLADRSRHGA
jgi:sugar lactone lactonase YvrE